MKNVFTAMLFMDAAANVPTVPTAEIPKPEPTSEKLVALKAEYAKQWGAMLLLTDPFAKETKDAKLAIWKLEGEMKAEIAAIEKAAQDAKNEEIRNARLGLNTAQFAAYDALLAARADKKADPAKLAELETAFNTAKEAVDNELLAKYAKSSPAKTSGDAKTAGEKGKDAAAIVELFVTGKTHKEIEEMGYARSTVWHAINNYKKANA